MVDSAYSTGVGLDALIVRFWINIMTEPMITKPTVDLRTIEQLRHRLKPPNEEQRRAFLRIPPAERMRMMLEMQSLVKDAYRSKLREEHPDLDNLSLTRLVFERLDRDEPMVYFYPPNSTE